MAIEICLEEEDGDVRFVSCVALSERYEEGLRFDADGLLRWSTPGSALSCRQCGKPIGDDWRLCTRCLAKPPLEGALRLWGECHPGVGVGEGSLWLIRTYGYPPVRLHRDDRVLDVEEAHSVHVLDGDIIRLQPAGCPTRHITVHFLGPATRMHAPEAVSGFAPEPAPPPPTMEFLLPPGVPLPPPPR